GQEGKRDRRESYADLLEVRSPAGVAGEIDVARLRRDHESTPQVAIAIGQTTRREVTGGNGCDPVRALPPVELDRVSNTVPRQQRRIPQWDDDARRVALLQVAQRGHSEMVVMIVAGKQADERREIVDP